MFESTPERVEKVLEHLADLPSLPATTHRLLDVVSDDRLHKECAELVATDQGLTAKVLRLANCAFFYLQEPVASLTHACALLGTRTLRSLVRSVSTDGFYERSAGPLDAMRYWRHSLAVAKAARMIADRMRPELCDEIYAAGLLHDCGIGVLGEKFADEYDLVLRLRDFGDRPLGDVEVEIFGMTHAEVGYRLTSRWRLPDRIRDSIRHHENTGPSTSVEDEHTRFAVAILRAADRWSAGRELGLFDGELPAESWSACLESLGASVPIDEIDAALEAVPGEVAAVEAALNSSLLEATAAPD